MPGSVASGTPCMFRKYCSNSHTYNSNIIGTKHNQINYINSQRDSLGNLSAGSTHLNHVLDMGSQPFYGKVPRPLLWAGSPAVHGTRMVSGITNFLNYCDIFIVYKFANVAAGRGLETDDLGVQISLLQYAHGRSQWPRGLRRGSATARLPRSLVRISPWAWMCVVSVVCCQVEVSVTS
jgi:hypothetical protein